MLLGRPVVPEEYRTKPGVAVSPRRKLGCAVSQSVPQIVMGTGRSGTAEPISGTTTTQRTVGSWATTSGSRAARSCTLPP